MQQSRACQQDRIPHVTHAGNGSKTTACIHDGRVHLDCGAVQAQHSTGACVKAFVFFEDDYSSDRRLKSVAGFKHALVAAPGGCLATVSKFQRLACTAVRNDGEVV